MDDRDRPDLTGDAQTRDLLRRKVVRQASTSGSSAGGSPPVLEATLASISAEVTAEAIERLSVRQMRSSSLGKPAPDGVF